MLTRNPNYHGNRPRRFARIQLAVHIPAAGLFTCRDRQRGLHESTATLRITPTIARPRDTARRQLRRRSGKRQYFVNPTLSLDFLALNTHRPLFGDVRLRQAVNYAIDRAALAGLGTPTFSRCPEPTHRPLFAARHSGLP